MSIGVYDEGQTFFGNLDQVFSQYKALHVGVLRVNLYWGGPLGVAKHRPFSSSDPRDAAYDWSVYDRTVFYAAASGIKLLFSITGTPRWANGDQSSNRPPRNYALLRGFAYAAAARYSGTYVGNDGRVLPAVRLWAAWNEPNNPNFLRPQFVKEKGKWVIQSARDYAKICNAVYEGVHATLYKGEQVACGVTAPRGNNNPASARPSVSPVAFLTAAKKAGMKRFDAYAHNPYYGVPDRDADHASAGNAFRPGADRDHPREHRHPDRRGRPPVRPETDLDHGVRLPDEPARSTFRRVLGETGEVPDPGVRGRAEEPADQADAVVPRPGRAKCRRLAVGADHDRRHTQAGVQRLPAPPALVESSDAGSILFRSSRSRYRRSTSSISRSTE